MKKSIRFLLAVLVVAAIAGGGYWIYRSKTASTAAADETTYTQVVQVKRGALDASVSVVGQLEAEQSVSLTFERMTETTNLLTLAVQAGNVVTQGQVLATIEDASYQQALDQAKSDLLAAQETLADLRTPATALEIAKADVAVAKAKVGLQKAQDALNDLVNPDIKSLEAAVASAKSALAKAQANVLDQQQDSDYKTQLGRLIYAETAPTNDYNRLSSETYSDAAYQDRLELAYNKMMNAQDARVMFELNQKASLLQAEMSVRKATAALANAEEALALAQAGGDKLKLANAKLGVKEAEVGLQAAQEARVALDAGADALDLATAQAAVDRKQSAVTDAEAALAGTQLVAPFGGTILNTNVSEGDRVTAQTAILTLADMKTLRVVTSIDETTIRQISAGQPATISFDAFPGQTFTGEVLDVPMQGTLQGDVMVYSVPLLLTGAEGLALRVGMTANVEIQVGQMGETLLVPTLALTQSNGRYQVLVPNTTDPNGDPEAVPVQIGQSDGTYTAVLKGLNEGDKVLVEISTGTSNQQQMFGPAGSMEMGDGMPPGGVPPSVGGQRSGGN